LKTNISRKKLVLGLIYGLVAGLAFSLFAWGIDAWLLARANATYYWINLIPGMLLCMLAGGFIGWLTIYFNKHSLALLLWGLLAVFFAWLVVWLPLTNAPNLLKWLDPGLADWLNFSEVEYLSLYRLVGVVTIGLACIIGGLLEINLVEQAMLSAYGSSLGVALVVCATIFALVGSAADNLINVNLREPVQAVDKLIQFAADHAGQEVSKQEARKMHLSAARNIGDLLQSGRRLTLISYDESFGMVDILVDFEGRLVKCTAIYSQPTDCVPLEGTP
jgi:hypothetical protein